MNQFRMNLSNHQLPFGVSVPGGTSGNTGLTPPGISTPPTPGPSMTPQVTTPPGVTTHSAPQVTPSPYQVPPGVQSPEPQQAPQQTPSGVYPPGVTPPGVQPPGIDPNRPDGNVIRSIISQAEQTWSQQNSAALELARFLKENGREPQAVLAELRQRQQEAAAQTQFGGQVSPQLMQYMQGLEQKLNTFQSQVELREGMRLLEQAETEVTGLGKKYGIDYANPQVRDYVRNHARQTGQTIQAAFRELYFDYMVQAAQKTQTGEVIADLQGRGQNAQPVSTAAAPSPVGPTDWMKASDKDFHAMRMKLKTGQG